MADTAGPAKRRASWFQTFKKPFALDNECVHAKPMYNKSAISYGKEVVVVPGRESHTGNPHEFEDYLSNVKEKKLSLGREATTAHSEKFWKYVRSVLDLAVPVGFEGDPNRTTVVPKGPADYQRFIKKRVGTEIINPINPLTISAAAGVPVSDVLEELLFATKVGLVSMKWAPFCERCMAPVCNVDFDAEPPVQPYCQGCRYENTVEVMAKVKVFFVLSQDVFYVLAQNFQCTASASLMEATEAKIHIPANSSGSGWRVHAGCGGEMEYRPSLDAGLYRMHCPIIPTQNYLRVLRDATDKDEPCNLDIFHSKLIVRLGDSLTTLTVPHGKIQFNIFPDTMSEWIFWIHQDMDEHDVFYLPPNERENHMSAYEVMDHPVFQLLYKDQIDEIIYDAVSQMRLSE